MQRLLYGESLQEFLLLKQTDYSFEAVANNSAYVDRSLTNGPACTIDGADIMGKHSHALTPHSLTHSLTHSMGEPPPCSRSRFVPLTKLPTSIQQS